MRRFLSLCLAYLACTGHGKERQSAIWQTINPIDQSRGLVGAQGRLDHLKMLAILLVAVNTTPRPAAFKRSEGLRLLSNTPTLAYSSQVFLDSQSFASQTKYAPNLKWLLPCPKGMCVRSSMLCMGLKPNVYAPLVICGPSGVGKSVLIKRLQREFPGKFGFCVSTTTRAPRPREVAGQDYHFVDHDTMVKQIEEGMFVEHAAVHTNYYGTSIAALEAAVNTGKIVILDIDIQGAKQVKERLPDVHFVFLAPTSIEELEARLRRRGTETEDKVQKRLQNAHGEIAFATTHPGFFDEIVYSDDNFVQTLPKMTRLLLQWYPGFHKS